MEATVGQSFDTEHPVWDLTFAVRDDLEVTLRPPTAERLRVVDMTHLLRTDLPAEDKMRIVTRYMGLIPRRDVDGDITAVQLPGGKERRLNQVTGLWAHRRVCEIATTAEKGSLTSEEATARIDPDEISHANATWGLLAVGGTEALSIHTEMTAAEARDYVQEVAVAGYRARHLSESVAMVARRLAGFLNDQQRDKA